MAKPKRRKTTFAMDRHVGARIRKRRIVLGLTVQQLAELIGVTYQQADKYERGVNRVSAGRLFQIANVLSIPMSHFFEDAGSVEQEQMTSRERMVLELARNFTGTTHKFPDRPRDPRTVYCFSFVQSGPKDEAEQLIRAGERLAEALGYDAVRLGPLEQRQLPKGVQHASGKYARSERNQPPR
jgi:transcriptional regulator with XRE-family HTH domain